MRNSVGTATHILDPPSNTSPAKLPVRRVGYLEISTRRDAWQGIDDFGHALPTADASGYGLCRGFQSRWPLLTAMLARERRSMPTNELRSADDFLTAVTVYDEVIPLAASARDVWTELSAGDHRFLPGVSVEWVTPTPHGVGTLRVMNCGPVHLRSRYFAWDEVGRSKAFYLENPPFGLREFIEYYRVTEDGSGSVVSFRLAVVPKPLIRPLMPAMSAWITFLMRNWQLRFVRRRFGRGGVR